VAYAFNFLDRQVLSVALESIKVDLVLSDTELGVLTGVAFAIFYSVVGIPIARWADRGNRAVIISLCLGLLSVTVALCGVVANFLQLMLVRVGVGVGEAGVVPPAHSLVATYFERSERLRAMSIFLLGGPLSMAVGYLVGGWITQFYGWRSAFLATAIPGVILAALVRLTVYEPRLAGDRPRDTEESHRDASGVAKPATCEAKPTAREVAGVLWGQRTFRYLLFAFAIDYLCGNGLLQWLPVFFIRVHAMSTGELGTWLALNWGVGNAIGTFLGGYLTTHATANAERRQLKIMAIIAAVYVPINIAVLLSPGKHLALTLLFFGALVNALATAPSFALIQSLVPEHMRATAVAALFLLGNFIGLGLGPFVVGVLSDGLARTYGVNALRLALLACTPGYWWVASQYYRASRTVMDDLANIERGQYAPAATSTTLA